MQFFMDMHNVDAPDSKAAERVHREAHGLVADAIYPVEKGN